MSSIYKKNTFIIVGFIIVVAMLILIISLLNIDKTNYTVSFNSSVGEPKIENILIVFSPLPLEGLENIKGFSYFVETGNPEIFISNIRNRYKDNFSVYQLKNIPIEEEVLNVTEYIVNGAIHNVGIYAIPKNRSSNLQYLTSYLENNEFINPQENVKRLLQFRSVDGGLAVPFNIFVQVQQVEHVNEHHAEKEYQLKIK